MRPIAIAVLLVVGWIRPAPGDERSTFFGKDVDGWIEVLRDKSSPARERRLAIWALGHFGPEAKEAIPLLVDALHQPKPDQDLAIEALSRIGPAGEAAVPILIDRFIQRGCQHRTGSGTFLYDASMETALVRIGVPAVPALVEILNGPDEDMRVCAAEVLGKIGPAARNSVPHLIRAMENQNPGITEVVLRREAIRALGRIGPDSKAAVPAMMRWLDPEVVDDDLVIVIALDKIGKPPSEKLLELFLREGDDRAAFMLGRLGPRAKGVVPGLRTALDDERPAVRLGAAIALTRIDPPAPEAVALLVDALDRPEYADVADGRVVLPLARLGPSAGVAMAKLIVLARKHPDDEIFHALVAIAPDDPGCVAVLIEALKNEDQQTAFAAATNLGLLGPRARGAVPALVECIRGRAGLRLLRGGYPEKSLRPGAIRSLGRIDPGSTAVIASLIEVVEEWSGRAKKPFQDDDEKSVAGKSAQAAAKILGSIGPRASPAVPALVDLLRKRGEDDREFFVIEEVVRALGRIGPDAKVAIPVLREMVKDGSCERISLAIALDRLAPDGHVELERLLGNVPNLQTEGLVRVGLSQRAKILGALGRSSAEADWWTLDYLGRLDSMFFDPDDPWSDDTSEDLESWIEELGHHGVAARLAIPRLDEYRRHPDPWVRLWATEALRQITPTPPTK